MSPEPGSTLRIAGILAVWQSLSPNLGLYVAIDPESLLEEIDEESFRTSDEKLPYFATLWPSAKALVPEILKREDLQGRPALDLGCGLGLTGLAMARAGAVVDFLDWEARALEFVRESALAQDLPVGALHQRDWRSLEFDRPFDLIIGADVLYERRLIEPVAAFLARALSERGEAWITDPHRVLAADFDAAAEAHGLRIQHEKLPHPESSERAIRWWILRRA